MISAWWQAIRPRTLGAGAVPVAVGVAWASRSVAIDAGVALATLAAALALQIAANLANDAFDFRRGIDTAERLGPARASASGAIAADTVARAAYACIALAVLLGMFLTSRGGLPMVVAGVAATSCALAYSAGPLPLASLGFGEALAFLFFGVVAVAGSAALQGASPSAATLLVSVPIGALVSAIMVVNNLRDIPTDRVTGKRTLAVRLGDRATRRLYAVLVLGAFACVPWIASVAGSGALLPVLAVPLGIIELRHLRERQGAALNLSLAGTARLHALFGALYALGLAL